MEGSKLIGITGMPGAGKTTVSGFLSELGVPVLSMGDIIREKTIEFGYDINKESQKVIVRKLREMYGEDAVAKLTFEKASRLNSKVIAIDGIRSLAEVKYFKERFAKVVILGVHASPARRFSLLRERGRPDDPRTFEEFSERDMLELSLGLGSVIALSDIMIVNEELTLEELKERVKEVFNRLAGDE